jgi:hypothetical protein
MMRWPWHDCCYTIFHFHFLSLSITSFLTFFLLSFFLLSSCTTSYLDPYQHIPRSCIRIRMSVYTSLIQYLPTYHLWSKTGHWWGTFVFLCPSIMTGKITWPSSIWCRFFWQLISFTPRCTGCRCSGNIQICAPAVTRNARSTIMQQNYRLWYSFAFYLHKIATNNKVIRISFNWYNYVNYLGKLLHLLEYTAL